MGEAAAAHPWWRRYYFADPAEVARRVYFPRHGYFCLLFYRGRKQNNHPEETQAAGRARAAAAGRTPLPAACRGKTGSAPARSGRARRSPDCELGGSGTSGPSPPLFSPRVTGGRSRASLFPARRRPLSPAPLPLGRRFPCAAARATREASGSVRLLRAARLGWRSRLSTGRAPGVQNKCWYW